MPFYRKLPVVIEAIRWDATKASFDAILAWGVKWEPGVMGSDSFFIRTLEGDMIVTKGDYVIKGVAGEFYPCKPEIFAKTHEPTFACERCEDGARLQRSEPCKKMLPHDHECPDCGRKHVCS